MKTNTTRRQALKISLSGIVSPAMFLTPAIAETDVSAELQQAIEAYKAAYQDWSDACEGLEEREVTDANFRKSGRFQVVPRFMFKDMPPEQAQAALWRELEPDGCYGSTGLSNGLNDGSDRNSIIADHSAQRAAPAPFVVEAAQHQGTTVSALLDASQRRVLACVDHCAKRYRHWIDTIGYEAQLQEIGAGYDAQMKAFIDLAKCKVTTLKDVEAKREALELAMNDHDIMCLFDGQEIDTLIYALAGVEAPKTG